MTEHRRRHEQFRDSTRYGSGHQPWRLRRLLWQDWDMPRADHRAKNRAERRGWRVLTKGVVGQVNPSTIEMPVDY